MITIVFGAPGAGKSLYLAHTVMQTYYRRGDTMLELCKEQIIADNEKYGCNCTPPDQVPIFVGPGLDIKFEFDFEEFYEPYYLSPYRLGLDDGKFDVQFFPPYSLLVLPEAQRYYDGRQSSTFSPRVSGEFEKHRHHKINIILDAQRPDLIDLNIRRLCKCFIEMRGIENTTNGVGRVTQTLIRYREFNSWQAVQDYLNGNGTDYVEKTCVHKGNIFNCYNSFACAKEFIPKNKKDYTYLPSLNQISETGIPKGLELYYEMSEPKGYRGRTA